MRIKQVDIKNGFKRFNNLRVFNIPETAKLVVLLGPNGSGKSSFMEALLYWHIHFFNRFVKRHLADHYYKRPLQASNPNVSVEMHGDVQIANDKKSKALHFRSAYRFTSDFSTSSINRIEEIEKKNPIDGMVEEDKSVLEHYNRLIGKGVSSFTNLKKIITNKQVYEEDITPLANSFKNLYPDLQLTGLGDPTADGTFLFTKGKIEDFRYINLSSGEKAAFDLLLDLHVRKLDYPDSIICLDEPEAHIGLRVQGQLLDEMLKIIPEAQMWIATHSPGMMRRAFELAKLNPDQVVFLNFDGHDYDGDVELKPESPNRSLWKQVHAIALEDLASLIAPDRIYICEGDPDAKMTKQSFDANVFTKVFKDTHPNIDFSSFGSVTTQPMVAKSVTTLLKGSEVMRISDRDSKSEEEIEIAKENDPSLCILSQRDLENFLLSDEVITLGSFKYSEDGEEVANAIVEKKKELLSKAPYIDDVKSVAGDLFQEIKKYWKDPQLGQDRHGFMLGICAPLITPETETYKQLSLDLKLNQFKILRR